jgi:hypothetical protein
MKFITKTTERGDYTLINDGIFDRWIPEHAVDPRSHKPSDRVETPLPWIKPQSAPSKRCALKTFDTHVDEMYERLHGARKVDGAHICEELHDHTGRMEAVWKRLGGIYAERIDRRYGATIKGPVFRSNREINEYARISRQELGKRGFVLK